jgi:hypothetical protein
MIAVAFSTIGCAKPTRPSSTQVWPVDNDSSYYSSPHYENDNAEFLLIIDQPQEELNYLQERPNDWNGRR